MSDFCCAWCDRGSRRNGAPERPGLCGICNEWKVAREREDDKNQRDAEPADLGGFLATVMFDVTSMEHLRSLYLVRP